MNQSALRSSIRLIRITPDGSRAISVSEDGSLQLWNVKSGSEIHKMQGHQAAVNEVMFVPDGSVVVSVSDDRSVRVWDVNTGKEIASFFADSPVATCTIAPDPPIIIAGDQFGRTYFLRIEGLCGTSAAKPLAVSPGRKKGTKADRTPARKFDVFLCHNSVDKPVVKRIHEELKSRGIRPWLDEEQIRPGTDWLDTLEKRIFDIRSAAVFVGQTGMGPWQGLEVKALLRKFAKQGSPIIPVILDSCESEPDIPSFLETFQLVDFRPSKNVPDPLKQLIWGITGRRTSVKWR
jgi:hypothetical protein